MNNIWESKQLLQTVSRSHVINKPVDPFMSLFENEENNDIPVLMDIDYPSPTPILTRTDL